MTGPFDKSLDGIPSVKHGDLTAEQEQALAPRVPPDLIAHWKANGFCSYWDGLLWMTDPLVFDSFAEEAEMKGTLFARTAFGDAFFWNGRWIEYLDVNYWSDKHVSPDIGVFLELLFVDRTFEELLHRDIFDKARQRLPAPAIDECYGFTPPLALGGALDASSVQVVKLRPRLSILKQAGEG